MEIPFYKYHGNGNDFVIILSENIDKHRQNGELIRRLCDRHTGIGADGLLIVSSSKKHDFFLDYYNADGTWETLCANGSRCAASFMYNVGRVNRKMVFETGSGVHVSEILSGDRVTMSLKIPGYKSELLSVGGVVGCFVDSGARHFIVESDNIYDDYVLEVGRKIRYASEFQPEGINVNFYRLGPKGDVEIKTYEKGVEQVMLSCASGSAAVVFHLSKIGVVCSPVITCSPGGNLIYTFDSRWSAFLSEGPAEFLFKGAFCLAK